MGGVLATFALGGLGGLVFFALGMPAPFMLGSVIFAWVIGGLIKPLAAYLDPASGIRKYALALVGVVLGSYVSPAIVQQIPNWWPSLLLVAGLCLAMTWSAYGVMRLFGLDRATAWFAAQPAGLSEVMALAPAYTRLDYVVALIHLIRVSTVFIASPLIIWLLVDDFNGRALPAGQVHLWQTGWLTWVQYPLIAAVGLGVGKLVRFPLVWLLGPMAVSAVWAAFAVLPLERPFEFVGLLQVILGSSIGARMAKVSFRELGRYVPLAYVVAFMMLGWAVGGALVFAWLTGQPFARSFMSVSAGGASELSLLAVALGYEVAFVTLHHLFRMGFTLGIMPLGNPPKLPPDQRPDGGSGG